MAKKTPISRSALPLPETRLSAASLLSTTVVLGEMNAALHEGKHIGLRLTEGIHVLRVSWKLTSTAPRKRKNSEAVESWKLFKAGQWVEATKACEHTRSAVAMDWGDSNDRGYMGHDEKLRKPGEILQVCVEPKCKVHPKAYEKAKSGSRAEDRSDAVREAKRICNSTAWRWICLAAPPRCFTANQSHEQLRSNRFARAAGRQA